MAAAPAATMGAVALTTLAVDQLSKFYVLEVLQLRRLLDIEVAPGLVAFRMAWNRGVNFGLFASDSDAARWALAGLALAISLGVAWWAWRRGGLWFSAGAGALIGGALGNAWDRVQYGAVADFLNVTCCGLRNPFSFNVADVMIFVGAGVLVIAAGDEPKGRDSAQR